MTARTAQFETGGGVLTPLLVNPVEGRSGSTLMMTLLDHPQVAFDRVHPYEHRYLAYLTHLLTLVGEPYQASELWDNNLMLEGDPTKFGPIPFPTLLVDRQDLRIRLVRHAWAAFSESVDGFAGRPSRYYAEKTWGTALQLFKEAGIRAKVVNLVRDPRDIVASIRAMDARRGYHGFGRTADMSEESYLGFVLAAMGTQLLSMRQLQLDGAHDCLLIRYEDIVGDPAAVTARLSGFLDLDLAADQGVLSGPGFDRHATSPSASQSIGRWRAQLSETDVATIRARLGDEMDRYGYLDGPSGPQEP